MILKDQFQRLRDGDRFWYQNDAVSGGINDDLLIMTPWDGQSVTSALDWLNGLRLSDIVLLNTQIETIQDDLYFAQAVPEPTSACTFAAFMIGGVSLGGADSGM